MENNHETETKILFKKGMTLEEYMLEMKPDDDEVTEDLIN